MNIKILKIFLFSFIVVLTSCSTKQKSNSSNKSLDLKAENSFQENIEEKECDRASRAIPIERDEINYFSEIKQGWGEVASITVSILSTAGYFVAGAVGVVVPQS